MTTNPPPATAVSAVSADEQVIADFLAALTVRRQRLLAWRALASAAAAGGLALGIGALIDRGVVLDDPWRWTLGLGVWAAGAGAAWVGGVGRMARGTTAAELARMAEARAPGLRERLLAACELRGPGDGSDSPTLRASLRAAVAADLTLLPAPHLLPTSLIRRALLAAGVVASLHGIALAVAPVAWPQLLVRTAMPWAEFDRISSIRIRLVHPEVGERVVPAGEPLAINVAISGGEPASAWLEYDGGRAPLIRGADDQWSGQLPVGDRPLRWRVRAGDGCTARQLVRPAARPRLTGLTMVVTPPAYAGLPAQTLTSSTPALTALHGSRVALTVHSDQPLREAALDLDFAGRSMTVPLTATGESDRNGSGYAGSFVLDASGSAHLALISAATGFAAANGGEGELSAISDLVPTVTLRRPTGQLVVPADEVLWLEGEAEDDVGLATVVSELRTSSGSTSSPWREIAHADPGTNRAVLPIRQRLDLLANGARPGDRLEVRLTAIDRKGSRATSAVLAITVADPGYPAERLAAAEALAALQRQATDAKGRTGELPASAQAWHDAAVPAVQEGLAHASALDALRRSLLAVSGGARTQLGQLAGGSADDVQLIGRASRRVADRALAAQQAQAVDQAGILGTAVGRLADAVATLAAAEAAAVALADLERLAHDQDAAMTLAVSGGDDERSRRRLAAAAAQAGILDPLLTRITTLAPAHPTNAVISALGTARTATATAGPSQGAFNGEYFKGRDFSGTAVVRADQLINSTFEQDVPGIGREQFCARWTGMIAAPKKGSWTFITTSDDGVRLWLGDRLVIDRWTDHAPTEDRITLDLDDHPLPMRLEYYQGGGGAMMRFEWEGPDHGRSPVTAIGGTAGPAIQRFQLAMRGVHHELAPIAVALAREAVTARAQLALLAGDEAVELAAAAKAGDHAAIAAIGERLAAAAALVEARRDADARAVADLAAAAAAVSAAVAAPTVDTTLAAKLAPLVAALATEQQATAAVRALQRATTEAAEAPLLAATDALRAASLTASPARPQAQAAADELLAAVVAERPAAASAAAALASATSAAQATLAQTQAAASSARAELAGHAPGLDQRLATLAERASAAAEATRSAQDPAAFSQAVAEARALTEQVDAVRQELLRDANLHDAGDAKDRARARDADGAAALLRPVPPAAEELLRQAAAASDAPSRMAAQQQAADQQAKLADHLAFAAKHWQALDHDTDPTATRAELRRREQAAGLDAALAAAAADQERLATMSEGDRAAALKALTSELADDAAMRRELAAIAAQTQAAAAHDATAAQAAEQAVTAAATRAGDEQQTHDAVATRDAQALSARAAALAAAAQAQAKTAGADHPAASAMTKASEALTAAAAAMAAQPAQAAQQSAAAQAALTQAEQQLAAARAPLAEAAERTHDAATTAGQAAVATRTQADAAKGQATLADQQAARAKEQAVAATTDAATAQAAALAAEVAAKQAADAAGQTTPAAANATEAAAAAAAASAAAAAKAAQAATAAEQAAAATSQASAAAAQAQASAAQAASAATTAAANATQTAAADQQAAAALAAQPSVEATRAQAGQAGDLARDAAALANVNSEQQLAQQAAAAQLSEQQRQTTVQAEQAATAAARAARHQLRLGNDAAALTAASNALTSAAATATPLGARLAAGERPLADLAGASSALAAAATALGTPAPSTPGANTPPPAGGAAPSATPAAASAPGDGTERSPGLSKAMAEALDQLDAGAAPATAMAAARQAQAQARAADRQAGRIPGEAPSTGQPGTPPADNPQAGMTSGSGASTASGTSGRQAEPVSASTWGKLPPELARDLLQAGHDPVADEYRVQVDAYFRAIGERAQEQP